MSEYILSILSVPVKHVGFINSLIKDAFKLYVSCLLKKTDAFIFSDTLSQAEVKTV